MFGMTESVHQNRKTALCPADEDESNKTRRRSEMVDAKVVLWIVATIKVVDGSFSPNFMQFVAENFGPGAALGLSRPDLGMGGSFGGGMHIPGTKTRFVIIYCFSTVAHPHEYIQDRF
ncbi:hypothetical protein AB6A40_004818 [Gnathostoma spinigerum]|uniref:Uncharacterized protein n=1 Tax=Gnathostoma spinigerum TaxID=75299 RepID=A0ABD6ELC4_9BILA